MPWLSARLKPTRMGRAEKAYAPAIGIERWAQSLLAPIFSPTPSQASTHHAPAHPSSATHCARSSSGHFDLTTPPAPMPGR